MTQEDFENWCYVRVTLAVRARVMGGSWRLVDAMLKGELEVAPPGSMGDDVAIRGRPHRMTSLALRTLADMVATVDIPPPPASLREGG